MRLEVNMIRYLINLFLGIDQLINTLLAGHPDETLSSRLGRSIRKERYIWVKPLRVFIDILFFYDYKLTDDGSRIGHCHKSIMPLEQQNFREVIDYEVWNWNKKEAKK